MIGESASSFLPKRLAITSSAVSSAPSSSGYWPQVLCGPALHPDGAIGIHHNLGDGFGFEQC